MAEKVGINLNIFKDWTGKRAIRRFGIKDTDYRFDAMIPVPATDEEAQSLFQVSLAELITMGSVQLTYSRDTDFRAKVVKAQEDGVDFGKLENPDEFAIALEAELANPKERTRKTGEAKAKAEGAKKLAAAGVDLSSVDEATAAKIAAFLAKSKK